MPILPSPNRPNRPHPDAPRYIVSATLRDEQSVEPLSKRSMKGID